MFCKYCGNELPEETNFCVHCGKLTEESSLDGDGAVVVQPIVCPEVPREEDARQQERDEMGGRLLKFSIFGLVFGVSYWLSVVGLVFAILARRQVSKYEKAFGQTEGRATVGKHLSIAALIISVALMAVSIVSVLAPAIALLLERLMQ